MPDGALPTQRHRRLAQVVVALLAPVVLAVVAFSYAQSASPAHARPASETTVKIRDDGFKPAVITVSVGTLVVWENDSDSASHAVAFSGGPTSPLLPPGGTYRRTFDAVGTYQYACSIHPNEAGTVVVDSSGPPPEPAELSVTSRRDGPITPGGVVDYHVLYENHSDATIAQNTVLTVTLPSGATLVASRRNGAPFPPTSQVGQALVYALGAVPADSSSQIDLQVRMPGAIPNPNDITLRAQITASNQDTSRPDGSTEDSGRLAAPRLTVGVRPQSGAVFRAGRVVTYTLEYANRSDEIAAQSVTITLRLPTVATFVGASHDDDTGHGNVPSNVVGGDVSLLLGTVRAEDGGRIHARVRLADTLAPGQALSVTARIASATLSAGSGQDDDSVSSDSQVSPADAPNMYVRIASSGDQEVGGVRVYQVSFGNRGTRDVSNVRVALTLPAGVSDPDFGSAEPTRLTGHTAVWQIEDLEAGTSARPLSVRATIRQAGALTATATITGTSDTPQAEPAETEAVEVEPVVPLVRPTIYAPRGAIVHDRPTTRGLGTPGATVSLYLVATATAPGRRLGQAVVGADRSWAISPTIPISIAGWHWVTATQTLDTRKSGTAGASFVVNPTPAIDPESVTRAGVPTGGLNPTLGWAPSRHYPLAMTILSCPAPISPTLQASFYNLAGLMTGYQYYPGTASPTDARHVSFDFLTPLGTVPFELSVNYDCPAAPSVAHHHECLLGPGCSDDPPSPPPDCEDCVPGKPPRPRAIDPDGFVYDAAAVRAGATITQSIISQAWVTATRQIAPGTFTPWNALEYAQVNPQYTDSAYPDKVLVPGYYSFRVPPGAYRMTVNAPGFLPFDSPVLQVVADPVTFHIPLERSAGTLRDVAIQPPHRLFLPLVQRGGSVR